MRKQVLFLLSFVLFCSCATSNLNDDEFIDAPSEQSKVESAAPQLEAADSNSIHSSIEEDTQTNEPDLHIPPELKDAFQSGEFVEFPLAYRITLPEQHFLDSIKQMFDEDYFYLIDSKNLIDRINSFQINEYLLYVESNYDPLDISKIIITHPEQDDIVIFEVTQIISSISFYNEYTLCVELTETSEGFGGATDEKYHLLNLRDGVLTPFSEHSYANHYAGGHTRFYNGVIFFENFPNLDPSYKANISRVDGQEKTLILSDIQLPYYANGKIYYLRNNNTVYYSDFDGNETMIQAFEREIYEFEVSGNTLTYLYINDDVRNTKQLT